MRIFCLSLCKNGIFRYSTVESPSTMHITPPCLNTAFWSNGSRVGSRTSPTFSSKWASQTEQHFQCSQICLSHLNTWVCFLFHCGESLVCLTLWINHKRPAAWIEYNDTIVHRECVSRRPHIPLPDNCGLPWYRQEPDCQNMGSQWIFKAPISPALCIVQVNANTQLTQHSHFLHICIDHSKHAHSPSMIVTSNIRGLHAWVSFRTARPLQAALAVASLNAASRPGSSSTASSLFLSCFVTLIPPVSWQASFSLARLPSTRHMP